MCHQVGIDQGLHRFSTHHGGVLRHLQLLAVKLSMQLVMQFLQTVSFAFLTKQMGSNMDGLSIGFPVSTLGFQWN